MAPRGHRWRTPAPADGLLIVLAGIAFILAVFHLIVILTSTQIAHGSDSANYAEIARVIASGGRMYVDYWTTKPPGVFVILTPFVALFGNTSETISLAGAVILIAFVGAFPALAYGLTRSWRAALTAVTVALMYSLRLDGLDTTLTMTMFATWAAVLAVVGRGRTLWMVLSGALFAMAVLSKQPVAVEGIVLLSFAILYSPAHRRKRAALLVLLGGLIVTSGFVAWAIAQDFLLAFWDRAFEMNVRYVLTDSGTWHFNSEFPEKFRQVFLGTTLVFLLPLLGPAIAAALFTYFSGKRRRLLYLLLIWTAIAFFSAFSGRALKPDYFVETLPPLAMILAVFAANDDISRRWWRRIVPALLLGLLIVWVYSQADNKLFDKDRPNLDYLQPVTAYIREHTSASECLWSWGHLSVIHYISGRNSCASPAINGFMMDDTAFPITRTRREYMKEMLAESPRLFIEDQIWGFFPQLQNYANRYVRSLVFEHDSYKIYAVDRSMWRPSDANFGSEIRFIGYDLLPVDGPVCAGDTLTLAMTWQQISPPTHQYQMFVQLLTPDETVRVAGYDGPPEDDDDDNATNTWVDTGEIRLGDRFALPIDPDAAPGSYKLVVGLYDVETAERVPVLDAGGAPTGSYAMLQDVEVSACD